MQMEENRDKEISEIAIQRKLSRVMRENNGKRGKGIQGDMITGERGENERLWRSKEKNNTRVRST